MKKIAYIRCLERTLNKRAGVMNDAIQWAMLHPQAAGATAGGLLFGLPAAMIGGKKNWFRNLILGGGAGAALGAAAGEPVRNYALKKTIVEPLAKRLNLPGLAQMIHDNLPSEQLKRLQQARSEGKTTVQQTGIAPTSGN